MKIDRLIGILSILLQQEKVTAPYLAKKFEVSRRTINRDVENLCKAGIPVVTEQGANGGISIMEGFRMDRTLLTSSDMQAILAGLRSLDSVSGTSRYQQLMDKIAVGNSSVLASNNHIVIDLASWYKSTLAPKIELIQSAIGRREKIVFIYYSPNGESHRKVEPYLLVFQWSSWYVWGYCCEKKGFRLFKLNRMQEVAAAGENYEVRDIPPFNTAGDRIYPITIHVKALLLSEMKWRVIEEFGMKSFSERQDGKLLFEHGFADKEYLFGWLLSYGKFVELLEPENLRDEFGKMLKEAAEKYE